MSGGFRQGAGRPADPQAIRRDRKNDSIAGTFTYLPAAYEGPVPDWPLTRPSRRELELWASEWARAQASEWARLHLEHEVALYVRTLVRVERPGAVASLVQLALRMQADLGLTAAGMRSLRWVIRRPEELPEPIDIAARRDQPSRASQRFGQLLGEPPDADA